MTSDTPADNPLSTQPETVRRKRPRNLAQQLVTELSRRIEAGELNPGDKLPTESAIMEDQGVSRTVVREALQRLQASGLVETRHGVGTFVLNRPLLQTSNLLKVSSDSLQDAIDILELRISLEVEAAGLAAERRTRKQMDTIRAALDALVQSEQVGDGEAAGREDSRFHISIAQATGNHYFIDVMNHLRESIGPLIRAPRIEPVRLNHEHSEICAAIERQDSASARAAMRLHLVNSRERLISLAKEKQG